MIFLACCVGIHLQGGVGEIVFHCEGSLEGIVHPIGNYSPDHDRITLFVVHFDGGNFPCDGPERHIHFGIKRVDEKEAALLNASDIIAEQCQHRAAIGLDSDKSRCNER